MWIDSVGVGQRLGLGMRTYVQAGLDIIAKRSRPFAQIRKKGPLESEVDFAGGGSNAAAGRRADRGLTHSMIVVLTKVACGLSCELGQGAGRASPIRRSVPIFRCLDTRSDLVSLFESPTDSRS